MITEIALLGMGYMALKNIDIFKILRKWKQITFSKKEFTNNLDKTLYIRKITRTEYGYIIQIELPYGYTKEQLEGDLDVFREGLGFSSIQIRGKNNVLDLYCIKEYKFKKYVPLKLPGNKVLIADGITEPIIVDMNKFPHMLIGGDTGMGKSRLLLLILTNLIRFNFDVELYLLQLRKNDLGVFKNCKQVKANATNLQDILSNLHKINAECSRRENLIDNLKGYYNIEDYNKSAYTKLKYIYVVIEEFSFLNISRGDTKDDKKYKYECLKYIKSIVNAGRSSGVFLITSLQKPTSDSIPTDIKSQLCTRISLKIADTPTSVVILGDGRASKLQEREVIVRTIEDKQGYSYTIDHETIMENIKDKIVAKENKQNKDIMELLNAINL